MINDPGDEDEPMEFEIDEDEGYIRSMDDEDELDYGDYDYGSDDDYHCWDDGDCY